MAFSPVPNIPYALPSRRLYIQAPIDPQASSSRPQLKLKISPHLLIPCPPLPLRPAGHRLEEVVDVVLPVGGRVAMDVKVMEEGFGLVASVGEVDETSVQRGLRDHVRETLLANRETLGLLHVPNPDLDTASFSSHQAHGSSTMLQLSLSAAQPTCSPLTNNLIPTGQPVAHLTHLDLTFEWSPSSRKVPRSQAKATEDDGGPAGPLEDMEIQRESQRGASRPEKQSAEHPICPRDPATGLPVWAMHQVNQALKRVMKQYMIKRFPLIFDAHLQKYSDTFTLHRSIPDSLSKFLNTSKALDTSFEQEVRDSVEGISTVQGNTLRHTILSSANLTNRKIRPASEAGVTETRRRPKGKGVALPDPSEVVDEYMSTLQGRIDRITNESQAQIESQSQGRSQRSHAVQEADRKGRRMKRVLDEAVGTIGRTAWEEVRAGRGRNSLGRIKLVVPGETVEQQPHRRPRARPLIRKIPSILLRPDTKQLDGDDEDDHSMIDDGDEEKEAAPARQVTTTQAESSRARAYQRPLEGYDPTSLDEPATSLGQYRVNSDLATQIQDGSPYVHSQEEEDEMVYSDEEMVDSDGDVIEENEDEMIYSEEEDEDEMIQDDENKMLEDFEILPLNEEKMVEADDDEMIQSDDEHEVPSNQWEEARSGTIYMDYESSQSQRSTQTTLSPSTSYSSVVQPESLPESPLQSIDAWYGINGRRQGQQVEIVGEVMMERCYDSDGMIDDDDEMIHSPVMEASYKSTMEDVPDGAWSPQW